MGIYRERTMSGRVARLVQQRGILVFVVALLAMGLSGALFNYKPFSYVIFWSWPTLWSAATAAMIIALDGRASLVANPVVHAIGIVSYSLYLFQQFALSSTQTFDVFTWPQFWLAFCLMVVFVPFWSRAVELPLTRVGARMFPRLVLSDSNPTKPKAPMPELRQTERN